MGTWWRDVIREATFEGQHNSKVQLGLRLGMILFIISWVHAENHYQPDPDSKKLIERFRTFFSLKLSENLTQWNNLIPQNRN